mgnify:FL=1
MTLYKLTDELIINVEDAVKRYENMRELDLDPDFYTEVKPYADEFLVRINAWKVLAEKYVAEYSPKYFHSMQIVNIMDAMEQLIVQSFYKKTSKKRFMDSARSVEYSLGKLRRYLEEDGLHV